MTRAVSLTIYIRIGDDDGRLVTVRGREAWALLALQAAGERGCTPIDHPGPRWSGYVYDLRRLGIVIESVREHHGGEYPGDHVRYVLRSRVVILDQTDTSSAAKASVVVRGGDGPRARDDRGNRTGGLP
jgi:hypothetical protein